MKADDKVKLLLNGHLHLKVFDALQLLGFPLNREVFEFADEALCLLHNLIIVGRRVETVLYCGHIKLAKMPLELQEALMIRRLDKQLVSLVVNNHFQRA